LEEVAYTVIAAAGQAAARPRSKAEVRSRSPMAPKQITPIRAGGRMRGEKEAGLHRRLPAFSTTLPPQKSKARKILLPREPAMKISFVFDFNIVRR
jgi:hypothetical protein